MLTEKRIREIIREEIKEERKQYLNDLTNFMKSSVMLEMSKYFISKANKEQGGGKNMVYWFWLGWTAGVATILIMVFVPLAIKTILSDKKDWKQRNKK